MIASERSAPCAKLLIEAKAAIEQKRPDGAMPVQLACQLGNSDSTKLFLNARAAPSLESLIVASAQGHTECLRLLIEADADVNATDTARLFRIR